MFAYGLSKARVKAVQMLKTIRPLPSEKVYIENGRTGIVEGAVLLNYEGTGVWKVGRTAWLISKNGNIYNKQPYW